MLRVNNVILNLDNVIYVMQEKGDINRITVVFIDNQKLEFKDAEAAELWKALDPSDRDWRNEVTESYKNMDPSERDWRDE